MSKKGVRQGLRIFDFNHKPSFLHCVPLFFLTFVFFFFVEGVRFSFFGRRFHSMLGPPPPIPSRTGRRLSADLIAPRIPKGEFLVSFGPSAFVKCILEIESGKLRLSAAVGSEDSLIRKFSSVSLVDLSCAVLRLEDVVRPFHIVIVPKPGAILIPNLKIEVLSGKDEERAQVFAGLKYAAEHNASSNWTFESSLDFTPPKVDAPAAIYQLKKKWYNLCSPFFFFFFFFFCLTFFSLQQVEEEFLVDQSK